MNGLRLLGTGRALPARALDNDAMTAYVDTSDEWITSRTGIRQRYFCEGGESTTTLAVEAARRALVSSGLEAGAIDCLLVATSSGEYAMPSTACLVHKALGLREDIPAEIPEFIEEAPEQGERKIVRTKTYTTRPMHVEDAILQMELLGHSFFVFINIETEQTNVLYLRKDGNLGLLEPEY